MRTLIFMVSAARWPGCFLVLIPNAQPLQLTHPVWTGSVSPSPEAELSVGRLPPGVYGASCLNRCRSGAVVVFWEADGRGRTRSAVLQLLVASTVRLGASLVRCWLHRCSERAVCGQHGVGRQSRCRKVDVRISGLLCRDGAVRVERRAEGVAACVR